MAPTSGSSLALAHDYLLVMRGAERTFAEIAACWPESPIYTLLYDEAAVAAGFVGRDVRTSRLQRLGSAQRTFRYLLPLFPAAAERLSVNGYDTVVSSSSAFAHGVRPGPGALHVCYCHSPFRYAWHERERALAECPRPARRLLRRTLRRIRAWDLQAASRVTRYVANSRITQERVAELYGVESEIVHPPVAVERFSIGEPEDFFLFVGQIVPHKRVEVALEAARIAGRSIKTRPPPRPIPIRRSPSSPTRDDAPQIRPAERGDAVRCCRGCSTRETPWPRPWPPQSSASRPRT